jgi:amino acid transporter
MKNPLAGYQDAGSFVAGLVIGLSILLPVFAIAVAEPGAWQALWILGALSTLVLGGSLQAVVTARPRHPRTTVPEPGAMRIRLGLRP